MTESIQWSPGVSLEEIEKQVILKAFAHYRRNKTVTSNALGIAIRTLDHKLEKYEYDKLEQDKKDAEYRARREEFLIKSRGNPPNNIGAIYSTSGHIESQGGVRMESVVNSSSQHAVSMPERKEVQGMLPESTSKGYPKKAR